jgi:hypothetical protein
MWPFDDLLAAVNGFFTWIIDLVTMVMYGPSVIFAAFYDSAVNEINIVLAFANAIIDTANFITVDLLGIFENVWPSELVSYFLGLEVGIVLAFRLYHFAKDVEILGNKL